MVDERTYKIFFNYDMASPTARKLYQKCYKWLGSMGVRALLAGPWRDVAGFAMLKRFVLDDVWGELPEFGGMSKNEFEVLLKQWDEEEKQGLGLSMSVSEWEELPAQQRQEKEDSVKLIYVVVPIDQWISIWEYNYGRKCEAYLYFSNETITLCKTLFTVKGLSCAIIDEEWQGVELSKSED